MRIPRTDVAIVGGGISGLAAAYRLQKDAPHLRVSLFERDGRLGGKIQTEHVDGFILEAGPDCFLSRKPRGIGLCEELGVVSKLQGRNPDYAKTYVLRHGCLHRLPAGLTGMIPTDLDALTHSTLLSSEAKARVAQEPTLPPMPANGDESVAHFIMRRLGGEAFANLIEPLMGGIYAGQADQLSLAATFPQLRQLELDHGSLIKGLLKHTPASTTQPPFMSFKAGMAALVTELVSRLGETKIYLKTAVTQIEKNDQGYRLTWQQDEQTHTLQATAVILTVPAYVLGSLLTNFDAALAQPLSEIPYASTALVNLVFDEVNLPIRLDGYGYVIPRIEEREALACTWTSRKWAGRAPEGKLILRLYIGRYGEPDATLLTDETLLAIAQAEIKQTLKVTAVPCFYRVHRWSRGMPQYTMGHLDRLAQIEKRLAHHPGLFLAGAAYRGVGIPDCIHSGEMAAAGVMALL